MHVTDIHMLFIDEHDASVKILKDNWENSLGNKVEKWIRKINQ